MSEISVLANHYDRLVLLSTYLNDAVISLKKASMKDMKYKKISSSISSEQVNSASEYLISFLSKLYKLLYEGEQETDFIPNLVLADYKSKLSDSYIKEDLEGTLNGLKEKKDLSAENFKFLDRILMELDSERTTIFRKLRTARG